MSPARIALLAAAAGLMIFSCGREKPSTPDGQNNLTLYAVDTSNVSGLVWVGVPEATIKISSETFSYAEEFLTDLDGKAVIRNLPAGTYNIMAELINTEENFMILGQASRSLLFDPEPVDTVYMTYQQSSPLVINELYFVGCSYSYFYYYDQFIELYNSSNDTLYLDGIFVVRGTHIEDIIDIEAEDFALGYYVYKFPGEYGVTRNSPLGPKEFTVIATDAIDHSRINARCVNLLGSDWEFFCAQGGDYDNLTSANLVPVSNVGNDFTMNLGHETVFIATGEEWRYGMHFDGNTLKEYIEIPISTIIDGVEYSSNFESPKYLTVRVDAGLGGNGIAKYSGRSIQRRFPGLDSNNSTFDFEIKDPPTPGHH